MACSITSTDFRALFGVSAAPPTADAIRHWLIQRSKSGNLRSPKNNALVPSHSATAVAFNAFKDGMAARHWRAYSMTCSGFRSTLARDQERHGPGQW